MLPRLHQSLEKDMTPIICKMAGGKDVSYEGAFPLDTSLSFIVKCPRALGARAVVLRWEKDGEPFRDYKLSFSKTGNGYDEYHIRMDLDAALCGGEDGLFYYEFLFLREENTLFSRTYNNVDITLCHYSCEKFRLLVHQASYHVPEWFSGGLMYHIFVDRFFRGKGPVALRDDAFMNEDWEGGVKQFAPYPGAPVANNEFFGGNLWGIIEKLGYLSDLGVTTLYLSPIFKAYSNHKYDTGDYMTVDEMFGGDEALDMLIKAAAKQGIRIILDGVFNHTGNDSLYFNRYGKYPSKGAYQSKSSPYYDWYCFKQYPDSYDAWWDIEILPRLNPESQACRNFLAGQGGVAETYIKKGIGGWRLDVADELSDAFLDLLNQTVKQASDNQGLLIGEVWENAADKIAYGKRRRYFRGKQLDSVMNYPLRQAILAFVERGDARAFYDGVTEIYSSYPREVCDALMNVLGTHDTERILSVLGGAPIDTEDNAWLSRYRMEEEQRELGFSRLKMASALQFTLFGVPSVFYGDEAGMEGGHDPFCRMPYPWGKENASLLAHYKTLGQIRKTNSVFKHGEFRFLWVGDNALAYERRDEKLSVVVIANRGMSSVAFSVDGTAKDLMTQEAVCDTIVVPADSFRILSVENNGTFRKGASYAGKID